MPTVKVSSKGQIVMPKKVRDTLGIKPRQKVFIKAEQGYAKITPLPENPVESFCGVFKKGSLLTKALLKGRKEDIKREEKDIT